MRSHFRKQTYMRTLFYRIAVLKILICLSGAGMAQNVVPNPDFDSGSTGWSGGSIYATDGMPSAPSYLVASLPYNQQAADSDCFTLDPTKRYSFSSQARVLSGDVGIIWLLAYQDSACTTFAGGGYVSLGNLVGNGNIPGNWTGIPPSAQIAPLTNNVMSGKIRLVANTASDYPAAILFDHVILQPEDIFVGDFETH